MDTEYAAGDEAGPRSGIASKAVHSMAVTLRPFVSKRAQKAYLGIFLFISTAITMIFISTFAYGIFYYRFIPQVGLERLVHLQFGDGHPWGVASLGTGLVSSQPYDVQVELELPRTPSNLAAGNFMLDLALLPHPSTSAETGSNTSVTALSKSRRPAILTYASPLVDTASKISFLPLYVLGWNREAEKLQVPMMERVQFARGWRNLPDSLRLEIHSSERMQVYKAKVMFKARFTGLRWVMYNWRLTSFVVFGFLFWSVSMASAGFVWAVLATLLSGSGEKPRTIIKAEDGSGTPIKTEDDEPAFPLQIPESSGKAPRIKREEESEDEEGIKEEETEEEGVKEEAEEEADEELPEDRGEGSSEVVGAGTGVESAHARGVQRRRSHLFHDRQA